MSTPVISIVMPVYNGETYLKQTIASLQRQTFGDFEIICVDDGSTDGSVALLTQLMEKEPRLQLLRQENAGAGAARNFGLRHARGEFVMFLDCDDLFLSRLLEKMHLAMEEHQADVAACNFITLDEQGNEKKLEGVYTKWIPKGKKVFSYRDCPDYIMRTVNPVPWNKMYRTEFIRRTGLRFEEISSTNDITFSALSVAAAERVTYVPESLIKYRTGHSGTITSGKEKKLNNVVTAVQSTLNQVKSLPHGDLLRRDAACFAVGNYLYSLKNYIRDFSNPMAESFYTLVHDTFCEPAFDGITEEMLHTPQAYQEFRTVRKHDYQAMRELRKKRLIISLTTYPGRIHLIPQVVESLLRQSRKADGIVLWLAESQFPGKEADLPETVRRLAEEQTLTLRWCADLKAHKKYFYALQAFPEDLVVTVDDDLRYSGNMLSSLYASYLRYPEAVSTVRAHLMMFDETGQLLPYGKWIQETDGCMYKPSMQLMATGGAGVLHPPGLYRQEFFDEQAIQENCLWADDLWLKAMQAVSDVPVVLARQFEQLNYLPDSQENGLVVYNVYQSQNDVQMANIIRWLDQVFEPGILLRKLTGAQGEARILGIQEVAAHLDRERKTNRRMYLQTSTKFRQSEAKLKQSDERLKEANDRLQASEKQIKSVSDSLNRTRTELGRKEEALRKSGEEIGKLTAQNARQQTQISQIQDQAARYRAQSEETKRNLEAQRSDLKDQLQAVRTQLRQEKENAPIGRQLKAVGAELARQREAGRGGMGLAFKYLLYGLAWIPEKILAGTMFYLKNGGKETLKQILRRVRRG
jgi:glycosyltransferase involved in cell wall biosynthesis